MTEISVEQPLQLGFLSLQQYRQWGLPVVLSIHSHLSEIFKYDEVISNVSSFNEGRRWRSGIFLCCESVDGGLEYQRRGSLSPLLFLIQSNVLVY